MLGQERVQLVRPVVPVGLELLEQDVVALAEPVLMLDPWKLGPQFQ